MSTRVSRRIIVKKRRVGLRRWEGHVEEFLMIDGQPPVKQIVYPSEHLGLIEVWRPVRRFRRESLVKHLRRWITRREVDEAYARETEMIDA